MKYFTPELWLRLQDTSDRGAWSAAYAEWERRLAACREEMKQILPRLPAPLSRFAQSVCLHDGIVLACGRGRNRLTFMVRPDPPDEELFQLVYSLVEDPIIKQPVFPPPWCEKYAGWMYDEIGIEEQSGSNQARGSVFTHQILLRNGMEIGFRFQRFSFSRLVPLIPVMESQSSEPIAELPRSA